MLKNIAILAIVGLGLSACNGTALSPQLSAAVSGLGTAVGGAITIGATIECAKVGLPGSPVVQQCVNVAGQLVNVGQAALQQGLNQATAGVPATVAVPTAAAKPQALSHFVLRDGGNK